MATLRCSVAVLNKVPNLNRAVERPSDYSFTVRSECDRGNRSIMPVKDLFSAPCCLVPNLHKPFEVAAKSK